MSHSVEYTIVVSENHSGQNSPWGGGRVHSHSKVYHTRQNVTMETGNVLSISIHVWYLSRCQARKAPKY